MRFTEFSGPLGGLRVIEHRGKLINLDLAPYGPPPHHSKLGQTSLLKEARRQLEEYFNGARQTFDLPLNPQGTDFQRRTWEVLLQIPFGQTLSYQEVAQRLGQPLAYRAVGGANGKNPLAILIPCHRVINAEGTLGGYSAGLPWKKHLLDLEGHQLSHPQKETTESPYHWYL
ncbi:MAG: hypothetical protein A2527_06685 [Candidatus Lambdaproteobacteria bacterium RIFOXYD2_FULL_50_16]|uniref:Methylated-DNA--protein-cysteine methyltransferase n=1 Tax=Candidatus Lambdaproteobacteria bacterium RIFOXYD2_FULL_50_16 TaxID=1817772 RepID=A0A1F6GBM9_9PROT|nr:MAG: hypothetical protein A2527_06685 [Candidatus Lambdaproteobacteria bacterium RIFOXYD2_FULL_50_16]